VDKSDATRPDLAVVNEIVQAFLDHRDLVSKPETYEMCAATLTLACPVPSDSSKEATVARQNALQLLGALFVKRHCPQSTMARYPSRLSMVDFRATAERGRNKTFLLRCAQTISGTDHLAKVLSFSSVHTVFHAMPEAGWACGLAASLPLWVDAPDAAVLAAQVVTHLDTADHALDQTNRMLGLPNSSTPVAISESSKCFRFNLFMCLRAACCWIVGPTPSSISSRRIIDLLGVYARVCCSLAWDQDLEPFPLDDVIRELQKYNGPGWQRLHTHMAAWFIVAISSEEFPLTELAVQFLRTLPGKQGHQDCECGARLRFVTTRLPPAPTLAAVGLTKSAAKTG